MFGRATFFVGSHVSRHAKPGATLQNHTFGMLLTFWIIIIMICALHKFSHRLPNPIRFATTETWKKKKTESLLRCLHDDTCTISIMMKIYGSFALLTTQYHDMMISMVNACIHIIRKSCDYFMLSHHLKHMQ